jgi:phytanoyl-CoA hydroxylase
MNRTEPLVEFDQQEFERFSEQGYLRLGSLLALDELTALRQRADDIMLGKITYEGMTFERDSETGDYKDRVPKSRAHEVATLAYRRVDRMDLDPLYLGVMRQGVFRSITRRLIGENVVSYRSMLFNKPAERGTHLPWHRDPDYNGYVMINIWIALDAATIANGCMQLAAGSHQSAGDRWFGDDWSPDDVIELEVEPGEGVLLHSLVVHRSGLNKTAEPRRAFAYGYVDAAAAVDRSGTALPLIFSGN